MKNKLYLLFSILFCIATLFMGVGYASINAISLDISGEMTAQVQDGIFITEVKYNDELSNNVLVDDSKINSSYQTNLDSNIVLTNDKDSQITYDITIYNSNDLAYVFDGIEYTVGENTYSNENITYKLTNLVEGNTVNSSDDITFSITFYFKDSSNISDVKLKSLLNFKFSIASYVVGTFEYTGNYETFVVPHDGIYKIELWGAKGGGVYGGNGGYTSGNVYLNKNSNLFVYVGEHQDRGDFDIVFNGGGASLPESSHENSVNRYTTGGGSTDIRISSGTWDNFDSLKSRIMVSSAGGGSNDASKLKAGAGGGITGYEGSFSGSDSTYVMTVATGGTQTSGGIGGTSTYGGATFDGNGTPGGFGFGGDGITMYKSGGGSGYYGGGSSSVSRSVAGSGGGGSSFISGHYGCDAIAESSTENNIVHTGQSVHYSGYQFTDTVMIDGEGYSWTTEKGELIGMPTYDGTGSMLGNTGNGYAKIRFVKES